MHFYALNNFILKDLNNKNKNLKEKATQKRGKLKIKIIIEALMSQFRFFFFASSIN